MFKKILENPAEKNSGNPDLKITGNEKINGQFLQDPQQLSAISAYVFLVFKFSGYFTNHNA